MGKLKRSKFAITYRHFYLWVNPFSKDTDTLKALWLNVRLIHCFIKCNVRSFYRWVFKIKPKPLTEEGKAEVAKILKGFVDDVKPTIDKIRAKEEHNKIKERWKDK